MDTRNPHTTPDGYFEALNARILSATVGAQNTDGANTSKETLEYTSPNKVNKFKRSVRSMMGFAAGFAVMVTLAWGGFYLMVGGEAIEDSYSTDMYVSDLLWGIDEDDFIDAAYGEDDYTDDEEYSEAVIEFMGLYSSLDVEDLMFE